MPTRMRAAVHHAYGPPDDVVAVEEVDVPLPDADEVLVRVRAAGVNWADRSMTTGEPLVMRLGYGLRAPRRGIRGMDVAGVVEQVGAGVSSLRPGDAVFGWGTATFAELATIPAEQLVPMPEGASFEEMAGLPVAGTVALQALRDIADVQPGDQVLVNGASGGIGSSTVQIAKHMGAVVTGVCSTANLDLVRTLGAAHVIDYTADDFTTGDARYDLILDMADRHTLGERRRALTERGTLIPNSGEGGRWVGSLGRILQARLVSPFVGQKLRPFISLSKRDDLVMLAELVRTGALRTIVGRTYELDDAGAAIAVAGSGHCRGKVVVVPS